jgi:hypothetical protein
MSRPNLARSLLSMLAVQGLDEGDAFLASAGALTAPTRDGEPQVTLIIEGVAARLGVGETVSRGQAASGDLINFDACWAAERPRPPNG